MHVGVGQVGVVHYVFDMSLMANISCYYVKTKACQCVCLASVDSCGRVLRLAPIARKVLRLNFTLRIS